MSHMPAWGASSICIYYHAGAVVFRDCQTDASEYKNDTLYKQIYSVQKQMDSLLIVNCYTMCYFVILLLKSLVVLHQLPSDNKDTYRKDKQKPAKETYSPHHLLE
jgi:hypothetical protein